VRASDLWSGRDVAMVPPLRGRRAADGAQEKPATPVGMTEIGKPKNGPSAAADGP